MASRLGSFKRECGFYAALADAPASARAAAPESSASPVIELPAAPAWFARHSATGGGACLLFEDLAAASPPWVAGDQVAGASLAAARATLRSAAALHAAYWRHPQLAKWSGARGWLPRLDAERFVSFDSAEFGASWPRWRQRFPAAATALPFGVVLAFDADPTRFERAARRLLTGLAKEPGTLLHGDLRFDNVFLRRDASNDTHARFIDMGGAHSLAVAHTMLFVLTFPRLSQTALWGGPCLTSHTSCPCRWIRSCAARMRRSCWPTTPTRWRGCLRPAARQTPPSPHGRR